MHAARALNLSRVALAASRAALAAGCLAIATAGLACQTGPADHSGQLHKYIVEEIDDLNHADVPKQVDAAVSKDDYRFVGVNDAGVMLPGVEDSDIKIIQSRYGIRVIDNTGPAPRSKDREELQTVAWGYATQYNKLLRTKIPVGR